MKGWIDFGAAQWFWTRHPWIANPVPQPLGYWKVLPRSWKIADLKSMGRLAGLRIFKKSGSGWKSKLIEVTE